MSDPDNKIPGTTGAVLGEVYAEREAQDWRWGVQDHGNLPAKEDLRQCLLSMFSAPDAFRRNCEVARHLGDLSWAHILLEEASEAVDWALIDNDEELRKELVQVAAVAVAWIECLDRKKR